MTEPEQWLRREEEKCLSLVNINRPSTKWRFEGFTTLDVKAVLDRQPLLGTGSLPDWLRNLAHSRAMMALDNFQDNLCLWR